MDLARQGGLAQMQVRGGAGKAADVSDRRKGTQLAKIHVRPYNHIAWVEES
jgi:hypothetical protein